MADTATAVEPGTKKHLLDAIEALGDERIAALSYYAAYLRAQEDAEEDAWAEQNAQALLEEFERAARGDVPLKPARQVAAEMGGAKTAP